MAAARSGHETMENPALDSSRPIPPLVRKTIAELRPGLKHLHLRFIVVEKGEPTSTVSSQTIYPARVADETGSIELVAFDARGEALRPGDICEIRWGYAQPRERMLRLFVGKLGQLLRVGRINMLYSVTPDMSAPRSWDDAAP